MKNNILYTLLILLSTQVLVAQSTICVTKYYTGAPTGVDNSTATMTGPSFTAADFNLPPNLTGNQCMQITDVNVETCFRKIDDSAAGGNCNTIDDGTAATYMSELGMELRSCLGNVILEGNNSTVAGSGVYTGGFSAGNMGSGRCVAWDSQAASAATTTPPGGAGVPNNGTFTPQAMLNLYNGLNPIGANFNLFIADNSGLDPFCVMSFGVTVCAKVTYIEGLVAHSSNPAVAVSNAEMCENGAPTNTFDLTVNTNVVSTESVTFVRSAANAGTFAPYTSGTVLGTVAGPSGAITGTSFDANNITLNNAIFPENNSCVAEVYHVYARFNATPFDPAHNTCTPIAAECQLFAGPITVTILPRPNIFVPNTPQIICEGGIPTPFTVTDGNSCAVNNQ